MISTFIGAATFENGSISIEPNSRNLIIFDNSNVNSISVRGPYTVDTAIENESNVIRMPSDAMSTLGVNVNDTIIVNNQAYVINDTRSFEPDILRLPIEVKNSLQLEDGEIIQNSHLVDVFNRATIYHNYNSDNSSVVEKSILSSKQYGAWSYEVIVDNVSVAMSTGVFKENESYSIFAEGSYLDTINFYNSTVENQNFTYGNHIIEIKFIDVNASSSKQFDNEQFINIRFNNY